MQLKGNNFREELAKITSKLFNHTTYNNGFFESAIDLNNNIADASGIIQKNIRKEKEVNLLLGDLLDRVSYKTDAELIAFDRLVRRNINVVIAITLIMLILSIMIFYFYIIPKITQRLNRLSLDTDRIASRQYDTVIDTSGSDEFAKMATALDIFKDSLIEKEKVEAVREKLVNQLVRSNEELERFAFVCSHDLQ